MTLVQFYTYQEQTFDSYISKLIKREGIDAKREILSRAEKEISVSQLLESDLAHIATTDHYDIDQITFSVKGDTTTINDPLLGQAIATLFPKQREVIILSYFMDKTDAQIGMMLNLTPNAIGYRRKKALQKLKMIMEILKNEE